MMHCKQVALGTALLLGFIFSTATAREGENGTYYDVDIRAGDHRSAVVTASLVLTDANLYMFAGANQLPRRWATFVSDVIVQDGSDQSVAVTAQDDGSWTLSSVPKGRVTLRYRVTLNHENHSWSGGIDGAAYWREWGVFYTARSLFVVNGDERKNIAVNFRLPDNWRVTTPWPAQGDDAMRFVVPSHDVLSTSMFFAGMHEEVPVRQGPFEILLALGGESVLADRDEFVAMASGVLDFYVDLMGDVPRLQAEDAAGTPVVIINESEQTDGEAIGNNISILLEPGGDPMMQHVARLIFAHEFFHLWNGKSFTPDSDNAEWFKEGFTNYYALKALHHIGHLNDETYLQILAGLFYQRYTADDAVGRLPMTRGDLKHDHWGLIYAGGLFAAVAQDLQIRSATGNQKSIDDLMRYLFDEYSDDAYGLETLEGRLAFLNDADQRNFFDTYVRGAEAIPIAKYLALAGIDTVQENGRTVFRVRENTDPTANAIRRGLFGD